MPTSMLTREEFHDRVDYLFDALEEVYEEDAVAVTGELTGKLNLNAPSESKDYYSAGGEESDEPHFIPGYYDPSRHDEPRPDEQRGWVVVTAS